jgi:hypothetical protein
MFSTTEKDKNGIMLVNHCFSFLKQHLFAFMMCFVIVAINLTIFIILLLIEYHQYGMHMFDLTTLYNIISISFWNHMGHFCILLSIIFLGSLITMALRLWLTHYLIELLQKKYSKWKFLSLPSLQIVKEILRLSAIHAIQVLKKLLNIFSFGDRIDELQHFILEKPKENTPNIFTTSTFIALPLIAEEELTVKQAFERSEQLLKKQFGDEITSNYSLTSLKLKRLIFLFTVIGGTFHFILNFPVFPTLIICAVFITSLASFIENVTLVFKAALYNYLTDKPFQPFTEQEIKKIFY